MSFNSLVLADSPVINLRHEDTSGTTANDSSGNANHGTYVGSPTLNQRSLLFLPHEGKSAVMGAGKRVTIPASLITTTTYTYEFLIKPTSVTGTQCLAHDGTNGIYLNGDKLSLYYSASHHDSTEAVVINETSLLEVVVTAGAVEYFINRVSAGTASGAPIFSATTLYSESGGANEIAATVCEFAAYTTALAALRIRRRYQSAFKVGFHKLMDSLNLSFHAPIAEDVGSTAFDISGNDLDGTFNGSPTLAANSSPLHKVGIAATSFVGASGQFISVADNALLKFGSGDFFCGGIFKIPSGLSIGSEIGLITKGSGGGGGKRYLLKITSSGFPQFDIDDDTALKSATSTTDIRDDTDHLLLGWRDGNTLRLFIDDVEQTSTDITGYGSLDDTSPLTIMAGYSSGSDVNHATGIPSEVFIGNGALIVQKIKQMVESVRSRLAAEIISYQPVNYYRKDQASGNAIDLGSLGNDGVWTGSPTYDQNGAFITNESNNKAISVTTAESLAFTSHAATSTYSLLSILSPNAVSGSQFIFTDGTNGLKLNNANLSLYYSSAEHNSNTALLAGQAHLLGVSVDAGAVTFNVDGVADGAASSATAFAPTTMFNSTFAGVSDESAVFDVPLLEHEWLDIAEAAKFIPFGITGLITESLPATEFFVRASQLDTGAFIGDAVVQGDNTYTIDFEEIAGYETYADEVLLTALPKTGKRRLNSTAYSVGDYYIPADVATNDHIYEVTVAGTTAASEPTLDQAGGTTVDGTVTVQDMGVCPTPQTQIAYATNI